MSVNYTPAISPENSRILILSLRNIKLHVSRCFLYEFEDAIGNFDRVDMLTPRLSADLFKITNHLATHAVKWLNFNRVINPLLQNIVLSKKYDLIFVFCQYPSDLLALNALKGWRQNCQKAVCLIDEIWLEELDKWKNHLKILNDFDAVFLLKFSCFNQFAELCKTPCYWMPIAVDTLKFFPYSPQPERSVDVYNIGRRSSVTHQGLLDMAEKQNFFYIYDTLKSLYMLNYPEHRQMYINLLKRSRYFIANKPKIDKAYDTNGKDDLSARMFEGAAAGIVMLGVPPEGEAFSTTFNWQDAIIPMPYDVPNIAEFIAELDAQPERLEKIRRDNIVNSLLQNDWVYRWEKILQSVGMDSTPEMATRKAYLQELAGRVSSEEIKMTDALSHESSTTAKAVNN
jgi:hypothetical protein